jgi:hypothetical protein
MKNDEKERKKQEKMMIKSGKKTWNMMKKGEKTRKHDEK